jgi:hypothetical protein
MRQLLQTLRDRYKITETVNKRNLTIALIVTVTAGFLTLRNGFAPTSDVSSVEIITPGVELAAITFTPPYEGCGYMWAYHDDPELTAKVSEAVRAMDPTASANAQLFGEDCVYADGHSTFGVMETDFYVRLPANDLTDENKFGFWIKQVLDFVTSLPDEEIQGNKGFVEFSFIQSDMQQITVRVPISEYLASSLNTNGSELFQKYYTPASPPTPITSTPAP